MSESQASLPETGASVPPEGNNRRALRWLWIGFIISLAVNLLIIGAGVGAFWHFRTTRELRAAGVPRHFAPFFRWLPRERRKVFRELLSEPRPAMAPYRKKVRAAQRAAAKALAAEPFDRERFSEANRSLHAARANLRAAKVELFPKIAEKMTLEERLSYLKWRKTHRRRWRRWHRRFGEE